MSTDTAAASDPARLPEGRARAEDTEDARPQKQRAMLDDRWPDRFAAALFGFSALALVAALIPPLRRYFDEPNDVVSMLTIPIVPNLVYASMLAVVGVGLLRRLRAAWWIMVIWLIGLPELDRVLELAMGEGYWLQVVGLVLMGAVLVLAVRVKPQFAARTVRGNGLIALVVFLVGGFVTVVVGATLIDRFGSAPDVGQAGVRVLSGLFGDIGLQGLDVDVTAPLWVNLLIGLMGAATVLGSAYLLFRAPRHTHTLDAADEARVRTLLRAFGECDSLGYFATRRDKSIVWDSGDPATARAVSPTG